MPEHDNRSQPQVRGPRWRRQVLAAVGLALGAMALPALPASASSTRTTVACVSTAEVHMPKFDNVARQTWTAATVRRCGPGVRACVTLHFGRVTGGWGAPGFTWSPLSSKCVSLSIGVLTYPTTAKKRCDPGYVYSELQIFNVSGKVIDTDKSGLYDATGCAT